MEPMLRFKADDGSDFPDWEEMTLGELFYISAGGDIDKNNCAVKQSKDYPYPIYANALVNGGLYGYTNYYKIDGDTFTVTGRGDVGHAVARHCKYVPIVRLLVCRPNMDDDVDFFAEQINYTSIFTESTGVPQLTAPQLSKTKVKRPSLPEQRKIADLLSAVDDVIAAQEAEVAAWEKRKKGVMQKLFSQEVRFKADDGSDFPDWEEQKIEDVCVLNPRTEQLDDEFYYMDLGSIDHGRWEAPEIVNKVDAPSRAQRVAAIDDVFFQSVRPYNMGHYHYVAAKDKQVVASTGYIQARMRNGSNAFLYQLFYEERFNAEVNARCTGSNYPAINSRKFGEITVALPSLPEQRKIADCLSALDDVIIKAKNELAKWQELKKGLLQQMFV